ncbi:MAG: acyltransferase [Clostridiales bacterium]|nr:acyltransferase [Clostridiales bacterium]
MKERNAGLDVLRLVSMMLVVQHHILTHGGLGAAAIGTQSHFLVCLLEAVSACAVNCFALLSGFVSSGAAKKPFSRGAWLWLSAASWSVLLTAVFGEKGAEMLPALKRALTPVISQQYWYFTAFFPLLVLSPLLERVAESAGRELFSAVVACFFIFCLLPAYAETDLFGTGNGYYTLWLLVLYLAGAALYRSSAFSRIPAALWLLSFALFCLMTAGLKARADMPGMEYTAPLRYTAPLTVLASVSITLFFANLPITKKAGGVLSRISPAAFGVYLIHDHSAVRARFFEGRFASLAELQPWSLLLRLFGYVLVVFFICLALESLRILLFRVLRIPELLRKA